MNKIKKRIFGSILILVLVAVSTSTAFAGVGNYSYATVNNIKYYFYSSTYGNDYLAWGGTTVGTEGYVSVPGGWMGVKPKLYNSDGKLVFSREWYYSTKACAEIYCRAGETSEKGTYYAVGNVKLYNSNGGYDSFNTMKSPYVTLSSESEDIEIERNDNGEIFGSEYFLNQIGIQPDLIAAIGDNGTYGFVKNSDLNYDLTPASPQEAMNLTYSDYNIPLYCEDGTTVIDTFTIKAGYAEYGLK